MNKWMAAAVAAAALGSTAAFAQAMHDPEKALAAQKQAMAPLAYMDGVWRGDGWTILPSGERREVIQTERIGPFLGGTVKVFEGRGYDAGGKVAFNALGILSYDPAKKAFTIRSYAMGHAGDFPVTLRADGFNWEIQQGPNARVIYSATIKDGTWHEVGDRHVSGREPFRFLEMKLRRVGDTDWPAGSPIPPK